MTTTHPTACILCSRNCGLEVTTDGRRITKVRGDRQHPVSRGYLCQKAARLAHYHTHEERLTGPLRRRPDGTFEPIAWDTAIREIATTLVGIRDEHGGRAFAYYGGGGQGNHLGGLYGHALLDAMKSRYHYSPLAQEKTGDFWVNGEVFGRQTCHGTEDVEQTDFLVVIGANPWQAHGIPNARDTLKAISKDPDRTLVVVDPRRTETADLADIHLQVRPGCDAFLLAAIIAVWINEDRVDHAFIDRHTTGYDALRAAVAELSLPELAVRADVPLGTIEQVARAMAEAQSACVRVDLGLQQSLHSTLNSYLEKLLFLLSGNFGRPGGNNLHTFLLPLIGHSPAGDANWRTVATGFAGIGKLYPPNVLAEEITSDHPDRLRALFVDSANPAHTAADTNATVAAFESIDLLVVIDVAMTETARLAHYVLPAANQLEKWEATFYSLEFPTNTFHLRAPVFAAPPGVLPEPEIYRRLLVAMGELPERLPVLRAVARVDRWAPALRLLPAALAATFALRPRLQPYAAFLLAETLGEALPGGAKTAAPLWFAAHRYAARNAAAVRRAGLHGSGYTLGEQLFRRILDGRHGCVLSTHEYSDIWKLVRTPDRRVRLAVPAMLEALRALAGEAAPSSDMPFVLAAGERRVYNANTIIRDPAWRKTDPDGALRIHPEDAAKLGLAEGDLARCRTPAGQVTVRVTLCDSMRPGVVSMPHGYGMRYQGEVVGPGVNRLTSASHRDPITATPYHKVVPAHVERATTPQP